MLYCCWLGLVIDFKKQVGKQEAIQLVMGASCIYEMISSPDDNTALDLEIGWRAVGVRSVALAAHWHFFVRLAVKKRRSLSDPVRLRHSTAMYHHD